MKIYYVKAVWWNEVWWNEYDDEEIISHMIVSAATVSEAALAVENCLENISNMTIEEWTYNSDDGVVFIGEEKKGQDSNPFLQSMIAALKKENDY